MASKIYQPTRMCISCRDRQTQKSLLRLQCSEGELKSFSGIGRSFYLCTKCLNDKKKTLKSLMRICKTKDKEKMTNKLKEIIAYERKS
jgi:predicted RNA-binding protein YlxR (DUF448 family)